MAVIAFILVETSLHTVHSAVVALNLMASLAPLNMCQEVAHSEHAMYLFVTGRFVYATVMCVDSRLGLETRFDDLLDLVDQIKQKLDLDFHNGNDFKSFNFT